MTFDYKKYFPFATPRQEQETSIQATLDAFLSKNKRYVILELGTGVGKSGIAITVARYINELKKGDEQFLPGAYVLTTQKVLQEQYLKDFGEPYGNLVSIKSSTNYTCEFFTNISCGDSQRMLQNEQKGTPFWNMCVKDCHYKRQKQKFLSSAESTTNYSYFLAETTYGKHIKPRELLILDEAHNVESELSKFIEVIVSEKFAKDTLKLQWPKITSDKKAVEWIREFYAPAVAEKLTQINASVALIKLKGDAITNKAFADQIQQTMQQQTMLDQHMCKINRFLEMWSEEHWIMNVIEPFGKSMHKLEFKPVDVSPYSDELLFKFGRNVLLLSATIVDRDIFCQSVGIPLEECEFLSIDSPFPVENRPIMYAPVGNMSMTTIDATLPKLVEMIRVILNEHKNEKGIIHCHSYKIANYIKKNIKSKRLLTHESLDREQCIQKHMQSNEPTVLVSPSLAEGIDLKDDLSRFQIICKTPYPYLGDKLVSKRMRKNKRWYPYQTAKTIIQSVGRSIRNENDHAVTYILDETWEKFYAQNSSMFPQSFTKALKQT